MSIDIEQMNIKSKYKPLLYGKEWDNYADDYKNNPYAKMYDYDFKTHYINFYKPFMEHCRRLVDGSYMRKAVG